MKTCFFLLFIHLVASNFGFTQSNFAVTLEVQDTAAITIYHDQPLTLQTTLVNKIAQDNLDWNKAADAWLAQVNADYKAGLMTKEEFDKETALVTTGKRELKTYIIGTNQLPWYKRIEFRVYSASGTPQSPWPIFLFGDPPTESEAILDQNGYYDVKHYISPEQVAKRKSGTYRIQVLVAGVLSNEVEVTILAQNMPQQISNSIDMQVRLGNFYLDLNNADKAMDFANAILKKDNKNIEGLVLSGEANILKSDFKNARKDFDKALKEFEKQFPHSVDPPIYLISKLGWLDNRK